MAFCLSMIGGLIFFSNSYEAKLIESSANKLIDIEIRLIDDDPWDSSVQSEIFNWVNEPGLESMSLFPYDIIEFPDLYFFQNYTSINSSLNPTSFNYVVNEVNFNLFDSSFYQSEIASESILFIEGSYPSHPNEIAVEFSFANSMNLSISMNNELNIAGIKRDMSFNSNFVNFNGVSHSSNIPNITISGIFLMKQPILDFGISYYTSNYAYSENIDEIHERITGIYNTPILGFKDRVEQNTNHPFIQFFEIYDFFFSTSSRKSGYFGYLDPNSVDYNSLLGTITELSRSFLTLEQNAPYGVYFEEYIIDQFTEINTQLKLLYLNLLYINIPIGVFAILVGSLIIKTNTKGRLNEFLLLRSKGTPTSMIQLQIITESLFLGFIAALIGILGSLGIFYLLRDTIQFALKLGNIFINLPITVKTSSYLIIGALGFILAELSSLISFIYIKKLTTDELLKIIGQDQMDVLYDEKSLFTEKNAKTDVMLEDTVFFKSTQERQNEENAENSPKKKSKMRWKKKKLYKKSLDGFESKKKSLGWVLILISLIPIALYFLNTYLSRNTTSDLMMSISPQIAQILNDFIIIVLISPLVFIVGLIRLISIEKPSRLARITNWMSKFIVKENSKICAMNIVRRRAYGTIMVLFGIFISIFSLSQISLQSLVIYEKISDNVRIGADIYLDIPRIGYTLDPSTVNGLVNNYEIYCNHDVLSLEEQLTDLGIDENSKITNNVVTIFEEVAENYLFTVYYFNFSKYIPIVSENNKFLPDKSICDIFESTLDYNDRFSTEDPGIIVNTRFLSWFQLEIGDQFVFNHKFWNNTRLNFQTTTLSTIIVDTVDVLPGVFGFESEVERWEEALVFFDTNKLGDYNSTDILRTLKFFQLVDIFPYVTAQETIEYRLNQQITMTHYSEINFYNQDWKEFTYDHSAGLTSFLDILSTEFYAMGILTALGIAILLISTFKNDKYFNGVLLSRGFGKIGVYNFSLVEFLIIFLIPIVVSVIGLFIFVKPLLGIANIVLDIYPTSWNLPIFMNLQENLMFYFFVPFLSIFIFTISFSFTTKQKISEFFNKF